MSDRFTFDVFLSHNAQDKPRVRALAARLRDAGLRVWFDEWVIKAGDDIYLAIERGLESSRTLVLCMSPAAFGSNWVTLERSTVLFRDPGNDLRRFIPLLLATCDLPDALARYKYVDYRHDEDAAFAELLEACLPEAETQPTPKPREPANSIEIRNEQPRAELIREFTEHDSWIRSLATTADGKSLVSGAEGEIKVWDLETGTCRLTLKHPGIIRSVSVTPDDKYILSASQNDKAIKLWNLKTGVQLARWSEGLGQALSVVALPDGKRALFGSWEARAPKLWDIQSGKCLRTFEDDGTNSSMNIWTVGVSRDGSRAVSGDYRGVVSYWDVETGKRLAALSGHSAAVRSVKITPDGSHALSGSEDATIKIWDLKTGSCVGSLEGHTYHIQSIALSPDGSLLASTGFTDGTLRLWDWKSGICVLVLHITASPLSVTFSTDGRQLFIGTATQTIYVYRLFGLKAAPPVGENRRYTNAKIVLLGESGVGKSGLAHRLIEDEFVATESTHGMKVWRLDLPLEEREEFEREALLWDLAGQEDYRLVHQLFLDETALALLLINPQKDDPFAEVGDWLKALRVAVASKESGREVAKLLVAARSDVGGVKVSRQKIERFMRQHGFADYVTTSAKTGENCSDRAEAGRPCSLKRLIAAHIPWDRLPWTSTPKLLADVKNAVLDMKREVRLLRFAELRQRLEQTLTSQTITEADARTAVTLLANHGLVMPLKFGDLVLLSPELMNGYASAVIRAAREHLDEIGSVAEADVYGEAFDFGGVERLERPDEELLLRAMVQTFLDKSLCIAEDTPDGRQLIFPSQYRRERPIPAYPEIFVSYSFAGELQTIYTTLVVRLWYSRQFDQKELWRNAAEFRTTTGRTVGLVMERTGEGEGVIRLFFEREVPEELKVVFIEFVHRHLEKHARDVVRDRRYVCPKCAKPVTDAEAVRERRAAGKKFIVCQRCDRKIPLVDHLEQRLGSDPVARKVRDMEERDRSERDTQALEQILIGHMMAICGEANQIFRPVTSSAHGIDGEVEFKDEDGRASGKKIYVRLKARVSYMPAHSFESGPVPVVKDEGHFEHWTNQPADVYLVVRDDEERIRWMNVTRHLKHIGGKMTGGRINSIVFAGERLDAPAVWRVRDEYFPAPGGG